MMCKKPYMKRPVGFTKKELTLSGMEGKLATTPFGCGQCLPCRINKARVWTHRIMLENQCCGESCFVTLTYADEFLPSPPNVSKPELQKYLKRLRYEYDLPFRYFAVGEYGSASWRPHYHLALFGIDGSDAEYLNSKCWTKGFNYCGDITERSARYISGYVVKGLKGEDAAKFGKTPEFMLSSRKGGGLGRNAVKVVAENVKCSPYLKKENIYSFQYGKNRHRPLGRYLKDKFAEDLGLTEEEKRLNWYRQHEEIYQSMGDDEAFSYAEMVDKDKQRRLNMETKANIFRKRGSI